jgi:hypothetical protein
MWRGSAKRGEIRGNQRGNRCQGNRCQICFLSCGLATDSVKRKRWERASSFPYWTTKRTRVCAGMIRDSRGGSASGQSAPEIRSRPDVVEVLCGLIASFREPDAWHGAASSRQRRRRLLRGCGRVGLGAWQTARNRRPSVAPVSRSGARGTTSGVSGRTVGPLTLPSPRAGEGEETGLRPAGEKAPGGRMRGRIGLGLGIKCSV